MPPRKKTEPVITTGTVITRLTDIYDRCMERVPVVKWNTAEKDWSQTGEYITADVKWALKAVELMGQSVGMFEKTAATEGMETIEEFLKKAGEAEN